MTWKGISEWLWCSDFWLPGNVSWSDIQSTKETQLPGFGDPWIYPFGIALVYFAFKYIIISPIFLEIAKRNRINCKKSVPPKSCILLERLYTKYKMKIPEKLISQSAKELGWSETRVNRWIFRYRKHLKSFQEHRIVEIGFQFVHHSFYGIMGFWVLWDKPWLWDLHECYVGYPLQPLSDDIWWYYMIPLGFFWNSVLNQVLFEPLRKDSILDLTHHLVSILLMTFSWVTNHVRIGTIVLFSHHVVDGFLLAVKLMIKLNVKRGIILAFCITLFVWIASRLVYFPFWVIPVVAGIPEEIFTPAVYFFAFFIHVLQFLNVIWTVMMLRIAYVVSTTGQIKDIRSSDESDGSSSKLKKD